MARQFFEGQQRSGGPAFSAPPYFLPAELARMPEINRHPELNEPWIMERSHQPTLQNNTTQSSWATEFGGAHQQSSSGPSMQHNMTQISESELPYIVTWSRQLTTRHAAQRLIGSHGVYGSPIGSYRNMGPSFFQGFNVASPSLADMSKGKGKAREADFEAAFAQAAASLQNQQQSSSSIVELDDTAAALEQAMENVKLGDPDTTNAEFKEFVI
jgi:peroxin-5